MLSSNHLFFKKKANLVLAKSTAALSCLLSLLIISRASAQTGSATGSMAVSVVILSGSGPTNNGNTSSSCSVSASNMNFADYAGSLITATSTVSVECTNGTSYSISFNDTPEATPAYYLVRVGGTSATASDRLNVTFTNTAGATMTNGAATISGTGVGILSSATAGTITGSIAASQTGKTAGLYTRTMTLNIVYNSNSNPPN
jgi:spore coat protein U-like protein